MGLSSSFPLCAGNTRSLLLDPTSSVYPCKLFTCLGLLFLLLWFPSPSSIRLSAYPINHLLYFSCSFYLTFMWCSLRFFFLIELREMMIDANQSKHTIYLLHLNVIQRCENCRSQSFNNLLVTHITMQLMPILAWSLHFLLKWFFLINYQHSQTLR